MHQVLTPGVQHGEEAESAPKMFRIGTDRSKVSAVPERAVVDHRLYLIGDRRDLFGPA